MEDTDSLHQIWSDNPTGLIPKGEICPTCAKFNSRNQICCVVAVVEGKVLLVHRDQEPAKGYWGFPGGYLNWDETVTAGAQRELFEETGLTAGKLQLIGIRSDGSAGDEKQNIDLYFYTNQVSGEYKKQDGEIADIAWFPLDALPEKIAFQHDKLLEKFIAAIAENPTAPTPVVQ